MSTPATPDSYQEGVPYVEVTFQFNKDVLPSELNELQRALRVTSYRGLRTVAGDTGGAMGIGFQVQANGVANQLLVKAGIYLFLGYAFELLTDTTITGLTTPGANRTDTVWLKLNEDWIDETTDSSIAVAALGQTTQRRKLFVTLGVTENSTSVPDDASGNLPWKGAVRATPLATVFRTTAATITSAMIADRRIMLGGALTARDRNTFFGCSYIKWDGTTLTIVGFQVRTLDQGSSSSVVISGDSTLTPADGDGIGWIGGSYLYRRQLAAATTLATPESATSSPISNAPLWSMAMNDSVMLIAARVGTGIWMKDGTLLRSGDILGTWGASPSYANPLPLDTTPMLRFLDSAGNIRHLIDHNGFPGGSRRSELREEWQGGYQRTTWSLANATSTVFWYFGTIAWAGGSTHTNSFTVGNGYVLNPAANVADQDVGGAFMDLFNDNHNTLNDNVWVNSLGPICNIYNYRVFTCEWMMQVTSTVANVLYSFGMFSTESAGAALTHYPTTNSLYKACFTYTGSSAFTVNHSGTTVASAVTPVVGTWYRFRIEMHDRLSPLGVQQGASWPVVRYFINEVEVTRQSTNTLLVANYYFAFAMNNSGVTAGVGNMRMGPLYFTWNQTPTGSNL